MAKKTRKKTGASPSAGSRSNAAARAPRRTPARSRRVPSARAGSGAARPLCDLCRALPGTTEDVKWGHDLVFSVGGKMYAAFDVEASDQLGFKCDEEDFLRLVQRDGVIPAPYAARFGWVKVTRNGALSRAELRRLLTKAHALVASGLPARTRRELGLG